MTGTAVRSAQRAIDTLSAFGVRYVFGVPGAKIDSIYDALADGGPQLVVCRHEQNAAFMAAAAGLLTGVPGAVVVTSGPGTTNIATGAVTATTEQYPMVALCGQVARKDRLKRTHQSMDATAALKPFTKFVGEVDHPDNVPEAVANALRAAVTEPRGAAAVILPMDVLAEPTTAAITCPLPVPPAGGAPADQIQQAAHLIHGAERPVVLAGLRAAGVETCRALRELISDTDLPVVETFQAAGVVGRELEEHYLGRVGLFRNQPGDIVIAHADVLVTVGYDPVEYDPGLWNTDAGRTIVHIDSIPAQIDNNYQPAVELRGDLAATLAELTKLVAGLRLGQEATDAIAEQRNSLAEIDSQARGTPESEAGINAAALVLKIGELVNDDATIVSDIGTNYIYTARHLRAYEPRHVLFFNGQQPLGIGLPGAMVAALLRAGTQVVSISGDGGFLFSAQELETATRLGLHLTHVIMRDNAYDMVRFQEILKYGRASGVDLGDYDITQYAGAFGAHGIRVKTMAEFEAAFKQSVARESLVKPGVTIIDAWVDSTRSVDLYAHLHEGVFE